MVKFYDIEEGHAINADLVKFMQITKSKNEGSEDKFWVCFVFDTNLTCYVEFDTEDEAKEYHNLMVDRLNGTD